MKSSIDLNAPGFQGSEHTSVEAVLYPQKGDPVLLTPEPLSLNRKKTDLPYLVDASQGQATDPTIMSASYTDALGAAASDFSLTVKSSTALFRRILDDDWIDVSFLRHGKRWHTVRGIVKSVRLAQSVNGKGATVAVWTITGKSFGHIWERTPIWFDPYSEVGLGGVVAQRVFEALENVLGSPTKAVTAYLQGMLRELDALGQGTYALPDKLPNRGDGSFIGSVFFDVSGYPKELDESLIGISQNWLMPNGTLWQLAQEWSDPMFNELFCEIQKANGKNQSEHDQELTVRDTRLAVVFRERPFPTLAKGIQSAWFSLPTAIVPIYHIASRDLGTSGEERYNAYFVSPQLTQELLKQSALDLVRPLWNQADIRRHGFRRFDIMSHYTNKEADILTLSEAQRLQIRDWYCMNPYLLSGSIGLANLRPDIRKGTRVMIPGVTQKANLTFYVESVTHDWSFGRGGRTSLGVTRGAYGSDNDLLALLEKTAAGYSTPQAAQA